MQASEGQKDREKEGEENGKSEEFIDYDEVLKSIGRYGSWQVRLFVLLALVAFVDGLIENLFEFTAFSPKYRCNIPFCEHPQNTTYFSNSSSSVFPIYVLHGIPQKLLLSGESCEYLGFSSMPNVEMEQQTILNKVKNTAFSEEGIEYCGSRKISVVRLGRAIIYLACSTAFYLGCC